MGTFELRARDVHVWAGTLDLGAQAVETLRPLLSSDELDRANRFRFDRDRSRYIAGRGQLRRLLARYLDVPAQEVRFSYGAHEKPLLEDNTLWFNVSHSGGVLLVAVTAEGELGIDVELANPRLASERIAEHFFSPQEVRTLRSLPEALQGRAFLTCWTRKEAFIKARGDGLSLALDSFDVTLEPGQPAAILRTAWSGTEPTEWRLSDLSDEDAGYVAAIAVRSSRPIAIRRQLLPITESESSSEQERA